MKKLILCFVPAVVLAVFTALVPAQADEPKLYTVKLEKHLPVGMVFFLESKATLNSETMMMLDGRVTLDRKNTKVGTLSGHVKILAIGQAGEITKFTIAIQSLIVKFQGKVVVDVAGKELVSEIKGDDTVVSIGGETSDEEISSFLDLLVPLSTEIAKEEVPSYDQAFGFDKARKLGERWMPDGEQVSKALLQDVVFEADGVFKAECRLGEVEKHDGLECVRIHSKSVVPIKSLKGLRIPLKLTDSSYKMEWEAASSQDVNTPDPEEKTVINMHAQGMGEKNGKVITVVMKSDTAAESKIKLKK